MGKKVLVVGQGGREHALVWKLAQSPLVDKIYAAPGNPGIGQLAECVAIAVTDIEALLKFARQEKIDLTVVGPEVPLMSGIVDAFQEAGLLIFGPTAAAARLEGSKVFAKDIFKKYNIPTAEYQTFNNPVLACEYARKFTDKKQKVVIKADGLAAGKGVIIAENYSAAIVAINSILLDKNFGQAGNRIVIEEYLEGEELSFFAISDGKNVLPFMAAQDHKRVFDGDLGSNTGGMGAYSNPPIYTPELKAQIMKEVIQPTLAAMQAEGHPFQGVLYAGLMLTAAGPKLLEYNARFGDPETQVLMPMLKSDAYSLFAAAARGDLKDYSLELNTGACVCVVLASAGYPGKYETNKLITGLDKLQPETIVFHAGTAENEKGQILTAGGRVLGVVCQGETISQAVEKVYGEIDKVNFAGMFYRKDIASRAIKFLDK